MSPTSLSSMGIYMRSIWVWVLLLCIVPVSNIVLAANSVSVSPTVVSPGDTITISVDAQYNSERYTVYIIDPNGNPTTIGSGQGDKTFTWTVPSYYPPGTYTIKVDSQYFNDVTTVLTIRSSTTTTGSFNFSNIQPQAPDPVKNFFNRLLGLAMFIGWAMVVGGFIAAGVMWLLGKEAPQFLGKLLVALFLMSFGFTIAWWLTS